MTTTPPIEKRCTCGALMVQRENSRDGSRFWGCKAYPECTQTAPITETEKLIAAGVPTLFDVPEDAS